MGVTVNVVGILLLSGFALIALESVGYVRGGYNAAFWSRPLDQKLDHVAGHRRDWWWISVWSLVGMVTVSGGVFGLVSLLADGGEATLANVALGGYAVAALAWVLGSTIQAAAIPEAATQRESSGATPEWLHPLWSAAFLTELVWIVGSNLAYALIGLLVLRTGVMADWAGWISLGGGALTAIVVLLRRDGFPQLGILIPAVLGVALILETL